jgi:hypothetical protein
MVTTSTEVSTFAKIVDELRNKSEAELKMLYIKFFSNEIAQELDDIASKAKFEGVTDDEIVKAIQHKRYDLK